MVTTLIVRTTLIAKTTSIARANHLKMAVEIYVDSKARKIGTLLPQEDS
jgi:hypothetical protein